jgi:hypothetical protein
MTDIRSALLRTADWLEANRDNHITGQFACDAEGREVLPDSSDATCFCALGRLFVEAGMSCDDYDSAWLGLDDVLEPLNTDTTQVYDLNDSYDEKFNESLKFKHRAHFRGNPAVITYLRELANA